MAMPRAEFGVNGDRGMVQTARDLIAFLEKGGEVRVGVFSPPTGYSGWWDSYRLEEDRLVLITDQTDTSHYDPNRVRVYEAPWLKVKAFLTRFLPDDDAEEAFAYARHRAWEEGLFTPVRIPKPDEMDPGWVRVSEESWDVEPEA
ncbi:MAG: hypothetical protein ABDH20_01510 [Thermus sp.]